MLPACKKSLRNLLHHLPHSPRHQRHNSTSSITPRRAPVHSFFTRLFAQSSHDISFHLPFYIFLTSYDNLFPFILCLCSNVFPAFLFLFCSPSSFLKDGHIQWMCGDYSPCPVNVPMAERSLGLERSHPPSLSLSFPLPLYLCRRQQQQHWRSCGWGWQEW